MQGLRFFWLTVFTGIAAAQPVTYTATAAFSGGAARYVIGAAPNTISVEFVPVGAVTAEAGTGFSPIRLLQVRVEVAGNPFQISLDVPQQPFTVTIAQQGSVGTASLTGYMSMGFSTRPVLGMNFNGGQSSTVNGVTYSWTDPSLQLWDAFFPVPPAMFFDLKGRMTRGRVTVTPSSLDVTVAAGTTETRDVTVNVPSGGSFFIGAGYLFGFQSAFNTARLIIQNSLLMPASTSALVQVMAPGYPPADLVVRLNYVPGTKFLTAVPKELDFVYTRGAAVPASQTVNVSSSDAIALSDGSWDRAWLNPTLAGNTVTAQALMTNKNLGNHRTHVVVQQSANINLQTNFYTNFFVNDGPGAINVSIQPSTAGTVQVTPAQYANGTHVSLRFVPQAGSGFVFARWSGAVNDTANPVSFVVNGPMNITAVLLPVTGTCTYALNPSKAYIAAAEDLTRVEIQTAPGCPWTVSGLPGWMSPMSPASGNGPGSFLLRTQDFGLLTGEAFVRVQDTYLMVVPSCGYLWAATPGLVQASGGDVPMWTNRGCSHAPVPSQSWLSVPPSGGGSLMGSQFNARAESNDTGVPRTGSIQIGGARVPILQRAAVPVAPFNDVAVDYLFADHIMTLKRNGVVDNCGTGLFCPENLMLRSQMAELLVRSLLHAEDFPLATMVPYFSDVPATHSHFKWIQKLGELGVTNGCGGGRFCPDDPVTRGQMAAFLVRARLGINAQTVVTTATPFQFIDLAATNIFGSYVGKLSEWGVTTGCHVNAFCPNDFTTRGQMAAFLVRAFYTQ